MLGRIVLFSLFSLATLKYSAFNMLTVDKEVCLEWRRKRRKLRWMS